VRSNGAERMARPDVWLTTYWQLPDARRRNGPVPLLDADTGKDINGRLQFVGVEPVHVAGQMMNCAHYRVLAHVPVDVWYDGSDRLVRKEWVEDNHRAQLELMGVRR